MSQSRKDIEQSSSSLSAPDSDQTTRRSFLEQSAQVSLAVGAMSLVGAKSAFARDGQSLSPSAEPGDRHFFFHIQISSGVDVQYTFDARPLDMTAKKLIANYHGQEPILYTGSNGQSTFRSSLTDPLMKWSDRFSIINGVVMSPNFDGHDQGTNILFTGSPFGGDSYLPWANTRSAALDYVESGFVFASVTNNSGAMNLDPKSCKALALRVGELGRQNRTLTALGRRADRAGLGKSSLAQSSRLMSKAMGNVPAFALSFSAVQLSEPTPFDPNSPREKLLSETKSNVEMFTELMRTGITDNALMSINLNIDAHDIKTAQSLTTQVPAIAEALALVFEQLSVTPSPSGRSMLDDTTILIGTEFARTMRQSYREFETTGTDHNPLTNTLILAGRGIRGGQVFGQTDFQTAEEDLSKAHLALDKDKSRLMGRPFDPATGRVLGDLKPEAFDPTLYLGAGHVTNTLQQVLGIPQERRFTFGRNLPVIPMIPGLLA